MKYDIRVYDGINFFPTRFKFVGTMISFETFEFSSFGFVLDFEFRISGLSGLGLFIPFRLSHCQGRRGARFFQQIFSQNQFNRLTLLDNHRDDH